MRRPLLIAALSSLALAPLAPANPPSKPYDADKRARRLIREREHRHT